MRVNVLEAPFHSLWPQCPWAGGKGAHHSSNVWQSKLFTFKQLGSKRHAPTDLRLLGRPHSQKFPTCLDNTTLDTKILTHGPFVKTLKIQTVAKSVVTQSLLNFLPVVKAVNCFPQSCGKFLLLKTALNITHLWEVKLVPSPLLTSVLGTGMYCAFHQKRKIPINQAINLWSTIVDCLSDRLQHSGTSVRWVTNPYQIGFETCFTSWNLCLTLCRWPRTWDWIGHGPRRKPNMVLLKKSINKISPNGILLYSFD